MSIGDNWFGYLKWTSLLLVVFIVGLFLFQNSQRMTMIDASGAYLSLDLYVYGLVMKEPMSISWLLCIAFSLGVLVTGIVQFLLKK